MIDARQEKAQLLYEEMCKKLAARLALALPRHLAEAVRQRAVPSPASERGDGFGAFAAKRRREILQLRPRTAVALLGEIAHYGERAYRRGVQQAIALRIDEHFAAWLRYADEDHVLEVLLPKMRAVAVESIYHRLRIETTSSELIDALLEHLPKESRVRRVRHVPERKMQQR